MPPKRKRSLSADPYRALGPPLSRPPDASKQRGRPSATRRHLSEALKSQAPTRSTSTCPVVSQENVSPNIRGFGQPGSTGSSTAQVSLPLLFSACPGAVSVLPSPCNPYVFWSRPSAAGVPLSSTENLQAPNQDTISAKLRKQHRAPSRSSHSVVDPAPSLSDSQPLPQQVNVVDSSTSGLSCAQTLPDLSVLSISSHSKPIKKRGRKPTARSVPRATPTLPQIPDTQATTCEQSTTASSDTNLSKKRTFCHSTPLTVIQERPKALGKIFESFANDSFAPSFLSLSAVPKQPAVYLLPCPPLNQASETRPSSPRPLFPALTPRQIQQVESKLRIQQMFPQHASSSTIQEPITAIEPYKLHSRMTSEDVYQHLNMIPQYIPLGDELQHDSSLSQTGPGVYQTPQQANQPQQA
jgi:hypothetical protein